MTPKSRIFFPAVLLALAADQLTKWWVEANLGYADRIPVIDGFFYITHVRNPGAAFSLGREWDATFRLTFFIGISLVAIAIIVQFFRRLAPGDRLSALALALILGGAVGNLLDRVRLGEVVDFIHFKLWSGYSWPDFNLADTWIVIGVGFLVLELLASEGEHDADAESALGRSTEGAEREKIGRITS
jgi:signal peptidase II